MMEVVGAFAYRSLCVCKGNDYGVERESKGEGSLTGNESEGAEGRTTAQQAGCSRGEKDKEKKQPKRVKKKTMT